jgi:hypothetical protein
LLCILKCLDPLKGLCCNEEALYRKDSNKEYFIL